MAMHLGLPPPEALDLSGGNISANWKKFKQKYANYEIATGISSKDSATRVATLLTVIGNDAIDVFNTLTWDEEGDDKKIEKVLLKFKEHCEPKEKCQLREIQILLKSPRKRRKHRPVRNNIKKAL